jgi:NADPH:quinone reductase-like Zn-dependent oxidoreductase
MSGTAGPGRSPGGSATARRAAARPANTAAWLRTRRGAIEVGPARYTPPRENEIVVRNRAVAVNPRDWRMQLGGHLLYRWLRYPAVIGTDAAGEVVEVGPGVTRFKVGDRVLGHAVGVERDHNNPAEGAFQHYTVLQANMAAQIPDDMPYENAAVLPLALSTAASALYDRDCLDLWHPSLSPRPAGQAVLIWGGSTSVGSNAIQLAVASGYEVITVCSPGNFDYVKRLGASRAFDYRSKYVTGDVIRWLRGTGLAGAFAITAGSAGPCAKIISASEGFKTLVLASAPGPSLDHLFRQHASSMRLLRGLAGARMATAELRRRCRRQEIQANRQEIRVTMVAVATLRNNEVSTVIYQDFLPAALASGVYRPAPEPRVIGARPAAHPGCARDATQRRLRHEDRRVPG